MRERWLRSVFLVLVACAAPEAYGWSPVWAQDRERFKEQTVYFESTSLAVDVKTKRKAAEVANYLKANPFTALRIEGHADERSTLNRNFALAERRAMALRTEVIRSGINPDRIITKACGMRRLAAPLDAIATKENRRVDFILLIPPAMPEKPDA